MARKLDDWINGYLAYTDNTEPSKLFREWTAISSIAAAMQRKCQLRWGHYSFYPNMYIILVGPSGARKGTAMKPARKMLEEIGVNIISESITKEALANKLQSAEQLADGVDDIDLESYHSSVTIYNEEISVLFGSNDFELIMWLTDWYDCADHWSRETKTQGSLEISGVWVNILGAMTPKLVKSSLPQVAIGGGFTGRVIFVYSDGKEKLVPLPFMSEEEKQTRKDLVYDLEEIYQLRGNFKWTKGFVDEYSRWYRENEEDPPFNDPSLDPYLNRRAPHILKLSMVISASEGDEMRLTSKTFERAHEMLTRTEEKMPRVFSGVGQSEHAEIISELAQYIYAENGPDKQKILNRFYKDIDDVKQLDSMLTMLSQMGFVKRIHRGQENGRLEVQDESKLTRFLS